MLIDILVGLLELHKKFIIHRDLKLKNIFVNEYGRAIIGDLGIAAITEDRVRSAIGTPGYQAPEVYSSIPYN